MSFLPVSDFLAKLNDSSKPLTDEELARVVFYRIVGDLAVGIINYRTENGLSTFAMANRLGVSRKTLSRLESGENDISPNFPRNPLHLCGGGIGRVFELI
jgi:ribosome-binding protein aMBF1 (putative translation factor)